MTYEQLITQLKDLVDKQEPCHVYGPTCPTGDEYKEYIFCASPTYFDDPEDAVCRMLLSKIEHEVAYLNAVNDTIADYLGEGYERSDVVLYWRTMPEIETSYRSKITRLYARFVIVTQEKDDQ